MKNEELYQKSVDILLDAYNNRELAHGEPCGCAVGNLVRANCIGLKVRPSVPEDYTQYPIIYNADWWYGIIGQKKRSVGTWGVDQKPSYEEAMKQIESTGYTVEEILEIEKAFEAALYDDEITEIPTQIHGLTAVLSKLAEIHEIKDDLIKENQTKLETIHNTVYC